MTFLLSAWLFAALLEFILYNYKSKSVARTIGCWGVATLILISSTGLLIAWWPVWIASWLLSGYRLCTIARFAKNRLPANALRSISLRAYGWLVTVQLLSVGIGWVIAEKNLGNKAIILIAIIQLMAALTLLRATIHTWRHTRPIHGGFSIADKDLPTVSVLIPARNETDTLIECLTSIVASTYPKLEVIVYDDCSVNRRTPDIIRSFAHDGVRFIQGTAPDEKRWLAKNQAYCNLRSEASGEVLLFCGVDVAVQPNTIRQLVDMLEVKKKDMLSILPLRAHPQTPDLSLLQPMRYFWELCLPRRLFKRPPVLSTCWMIRASSLDKSGGFGAVARSIVPEAHFARQAVISDRYAFVRSDAELGLQSNKRADEQYATTIRMRYPQLHRRLEMVVLTTLFEILFLLGPIIGLTCIGFTRHANLLAELWGIASVALLATYYFVAVKTALNNQITWWWLYPAAVLTDIIVLHVSLAKYEFSAVDWKGRNVCIPVMQTSGKERTGLV